MPGYNEFHISAIDINPYVAPDDVGDKDRAAVAAAMDEAYTRVGFIQILGAVLWADREPGLQGRMA